MSEYRSPVPYPAIGRHGVIGDRRTAALVAADGALDWLCLPDYDGSPAFEALLDRDAGGYWKLGPAAMSFGVQDYPDDRAALVTTWDAAAGRLELTDAMPWPESDGTPDREGRRAVLRRLRCTRGRVRCALEFRPRWDFGKVRRARSGKGELVFRAGPHTLSLWTSGPVEADSTGARAVFDLNQGEDFSAALDLDGPPGGWSEAGVREALAETDRFWREWVECVSASGPRRRQLRRSAVLFNLLTYAPQGSVVAAPTTSLPERIGAGWNADYRYTWLRDASLTMLVLARLGRMEDGARYLEWLSGLDSSSDMPLQVLYGVRGELKTPQHERKDIYGYRGSLPIRVGNHAYKQHQHDAFGYLLDCIFVYLEQGGRWRPEFWELVRRAADFIASHWQDPGNSIWELSSRKQFLSGKVMGWVALDRAIRIADKVGRGGEVGGWSSRRDEIHADVMRNGWSDRIGAFRQHYEGDNLDAAALLIPIMGFLPPDHPRVTATVERIGEALSIDGFVYRFDPSETPGMKGPPLGEYEGAFLPCTFWMAAVHAQAGRVEEADAVLRRVEKIAEPLGLFAEGVDARSGTFLGNYPLLFSHGEYVRAVLELEKAGKPPTSGG